MIINGSMIQSITSLSILGCKNSSMNVVCLILNNILADSHFLLIMIYLLC